VDRNAQDGNVPWIVNVPILYPAPKKDRPKSDLDSDFWRQKAVTALLPHIKDFRPDLLLISAGFDAHKDDPVGHLKLVEEDFVWITKALVSSYAVGAVVPHVVSVLEGGYGVDEESRFSLSRGVCAHVQALTEIDMTGAPTKPLDYDFSKPEVPSSVIEPAPLLAPGASSLLQQTNRECVNVKPRVRPNQGAQKEVKGGGPKRMMPGSAQSDLTFEQSRRKEPRLN